MQLARDLGFRVFATASKAHHQYLRSLGAAEVFDYHDADVVFEIVASARAAGVAIGLGYDAVTEGNSAELAADVLAASGGKGSQLVLVLE